METKFRSLPLSLIDFFGVLLPGLAWLLLLVTAGAMFTRAPEPVTPLLTPDRLGTLAGGAQWLDSLFVVLAALVIGYIAKPRAMHLATRWPIQLLSTDADPETDKADDRRFPFLRRHEGKPYFAEIERVTEELMGCKWDNLPGPQPFGVMKRLLRLVAPALWEELEHREAEVRLLGSLVLASAFSTFLAVIELVRELVVSGRVSIEAAAWLLVSAALTLFAGDGFGHLRRREVEYAYLHTLVALKAREKGYWR